MQHAPDIQSLLSNARAFHQAGNLREAESLYRAILASSPKQPEALSLLGTLHLQRGDREEGIRLIGMSLKINPRQPDALNNRGNAFQELKRYDEALASYDKAIALHPDYPDAYNNRGVTLQKLKRHGEALASYDKAIALKPHYAEAYDNRGLTLQEMKRYDEALASFEKAIAQNPSFAFAYNNLANALREMKRCDEALAHHGKALALGPGVADFYLNRGTTLEEMERSDDALEDYKKAMALQPDTPYLFGAWLQARMSRCDWRNIDADFSRLARDIEAGKPAANPFRVVPTPLSPALQKKCAEIYIQDRFPPNAARQRHSAYAHDKIRLGYFSADFYTHATAHLAAELFERHDRSRFEITAFSLGPQKFDDMRTRLEKAFDRFIDAGGKSDADIAAQAGSLEIDIAIDLKGFTRDAQTGIFALRAAPVQVSYLGYPGTMGASYIDYLIADPTLIPPQSRQYYTEKIVTLPHSYQVNDSSRKIAETTFTRRDMGLPEEGFVFCCFNNNYKITPDVFDIWMRLLHKVDGSVLWLFEGSPTAAKNLRQEAKSRGIAEQRLIFAKRMPLAEHLARHRLADLFLDTFHCNAHTTASDALWAGLPLLTRPGETFAGRVAASLVNAVGLPEMIAPSPEQYEAIAFELATTPQKLSALRQKLAQNRTTCPLFNAPLFTRHIEEAYLKMWERSKAGLSPTDIYIQP